MLSDWCKEGVHRDGSLRVVDGLFKLISPNSLGLPCGSEHIATVCSYLPWSLNLLSLLKISKCRFSILHYPKDIGPALPCLIAFIVMYIDEQHKKHGMLEQKTAWARDFE